MKRKFIIIQIHILHFCVQMGYVSMEGRGCMTVVGGRMVATGTEGGNSVVIIPIAVQRWVLYRWGHTTCVGGYLLGEYFFFGSK